MTAAVGAPPLVCDPNDINERVASWMEAHNGFKETLGPNDGPELREWRGLLGIKGPCEWCALTGHAAGHYSALDLGCANPVPPTAGSLEMWRRSSPESHVLTPARGDIGVLSHGKGKGHVIVCTAPLVEGVGLAWASGNTNAAGSRTGDSLLVKTGDPEKVHRGELVGWFRPSLALARPLVA